MPSSETELDNIETLHDLSNAIQTARTSIKNRNNTSGSAISFARRDSIRTGLTISEIDQQSDDSQDGSIHETVQLLDSWQTLVEVLFKAKKKKRLIRYAPSLETSVSKLANVEPHDVPHVQTLVELMISTVENVPSAEQQQKQDSTELRFVTLLELTLSYNMYWQPTDGVKKVWKSHSDTQVPTVIDEDDILVFRRKAYSLLISLPWVPSSYGLYEACSMENNDNANNSISTLNLPMRLDPSIILLPRHDLIYQTLDRLEGKDNFTLTISSTAATPKTSSNDLRASLHTSNNGANATPGTGKTSFAALLISNSKIQQQHQSVIWIAIPDREDECASLTLDQYTRCLKDLCRQLELDQNALPKPVLRLEDASLRKRRQHDHMIRMKRFVAKQLHTQFTTKPFLIVLNNAMDETDYQWFHFLDKRQSTIIILSTAKRTIHSDFHLQLDSQMTDSEGIELFAREGNYTGPRSALRTLEAKKILGQCMYNPLLIKTTARWYQVKQVTAGCGKALEELSLELSMLRHVDSVVEKVLAEILNLLLSPSSKQRNGRSGSTSATKLMKLCFVTAVSVFATTADTEVLVPLDAIHCLWMDILTNNKVAKAETGAASQGETARRVQFFSEVFIMLGLLVRCDDGSSRHKGPLVSFGSRMYIDYVESVILEVTEPGIALEASVAAWHSSFVQGYTRIRTLRTETKMADLCKDYALKKLVYHMTEASNIQLVLEYLHNPSFLKERIRLFGWEDGVRMQLDDCFFLQQRACESEKATVAETRKVVQSILKKTGVILNDLPANSDEIKLRKAEALHQVGFMQANNFLISDALTQYKFALNAMAHSPNHHFNVQIMYSQAILQLARNDHDKALKKAKACLKVLKDAPATEVSAAPLLKHELMQIKGDALVAGCDYSNAAMAYEEALDDMNAESQTESGTALFKRGRLHQMMGELDLSLSALNECIKWKESIGENESRNLIEALSLIADVHLELQEDKQALTHMERALKIIADHEGNAFELEELLLKGKINFLHSDDEASNAAFAKAKEMILAAPKLLMDRSAYDLRSIARIMTDRGDKKGAIEILQQSSDLLTKERLESLERASTLYELGHCLYGEGESQEALSCFEEAFEIREVKLGDNVVVLENLNTIGNAYKALNYTNDALRVAADVLTMTEKLHPADGEKIASALYALAECHEVVGNFPDAVEYYSKCKDKLKVSLCGDHPDVANIVHRLALVYQSQNDDDNAYECYNEALIIRQANFDSEHPLIGETLFGIGCISRKRGHLEEARSYLQDAINVQKSLQLVRETCMSLVECGTVLRLLNDATHAMECFERCLAILKDNSDETALQRSAHTSMGHLYLTQERYQKALEAYTLSAAMVREASTTGPEGDTQSAEEVEGEDVSTDIEYAKNTCYIGMVEYMLELYPESQDNLKSFINTAQSLNETERIEYVIAHDLLGEIACSESEIDEARKCWSTARIVLERDAGVKAQIPDLLTLIGTRMQTAEVPVQKSGFFTSIMEMARFEDEVSGEVPIKAQKEEKYRQYLFTEDS